MSEERVQELLLVPLDENLEILHLFISPDGRRMAIQANDMDRYLIVNALQIGEEEAGVQLDYQLVIEDRSGLRKRVSITEEQFEGIKRMQQDRFGKLVLESAKAQVDAWRKKNTGPGADV